MEYRKLISFGKSSFVISIPKPWVRRNNLKKGDTIYVEEAPGKLILHPNKNYDENQDKEITISVNKKSIRQIQREIVSAYIRNYKTITLFGDEIKDKAKDIQHITQNLIALEVMEQTSNRIVAKDFLDMKETEINPLIKKMDIIIKSMLSDCKLLFKNNLHENIEHRDNDVNKLAFLLYRAIKYGLENPSFINKKQNLASQDLIGIWWITYNLEAIGDEIKRIARYVTKMNFSKEMEKDFLKIMEDLEQNMIGMMKSFYKSDSQLAHSVHEKKQENVMLCESFYLNHHKVRWSGYLVNHMKSLSIGIHNIGRSVYQY